MSFPCFRESDFDIFAIPDFAARMGAIRAELRPKLQVIGEELAPELAGIVPGPIVPHTAAHMRRRTNAPQETWVAFGRSPKGYKRFVHFRVAINGGGLRVTVHIEDDADDKAPFAAALRRNRDAFVARFAPREELVWYSLRDRQEGPGPPVHPPFGRVPAAAPGAPASLAPGAQLTAAELDHLADALSQLKTAEFSAGIPFLRTDSRLRSSTALAPLLMDTMRQLAPLYEAALPVKG